MKNIQFNTKEKLCILWGAVGIISVIAGLLISAPTPESESLRIALQNTSVTAVASAIISATSVVGVTVLKGILCATGVILIAIASINFVSAVEENKLYEDLMFDESAYEEDEFSCSEEDCACCSSPCQQAISSEEEIMEEVILEETEEISENQEIN